MRFKLLLGCTRIPIAFSHYTTHLKKTWLVSVFLLMTTMMSPPPRLLSPRLAESNIPSNPIKCNNNAADTTFPIRSPLHLSV